jgi:hypothetical protein
MVNERYIADMRPRLIAAKDVIGYNGAKVKSPAQVRVSGALLEKLKETMSAVDLDYLRRQVSGTALCPELYWFLDKPRVRKIFGIEEDAR